MREREREERRLELEEEPESLRTPRRCLLHRERKGKVSATVDTGRKLSTAGGRERRKKARIGAVKERTKKRTHKLASGTF